MKILVLILTLSCSIGAQAQPQPRANGVGSNRGVGSVSATRTTTNEMPMVPGQQDPTMETGLQQTAPSDITTVNPMDPVNDAQRARDAEMDNNRRQQRRAMAPPVSATTETVETPPSF